MACHEALAPVGATDADYVAWLCEHVQCAMVLDGVFAALASSPSPDERSMDVGRVGTSLLERRGAIRAWCRSQDILSVIGHYVPLDGRGVGSCPFKEHHHRGDLRPSFQVFGGNDPHWYCYTWRRAGDLFDFLCLYHQVTPQEAWERLRTGGFL